MKMYRIFILGLIIISSFCSSYAQPDVDHWDERIESSITNNLKSSTPVNGDACDWIPPYLKDIGDKDDFRNFMNSVEEPYILKTNAYAILHEISGTIGDAWKTDVIVLKKLVADLGKDADLIDYLRDDPSLFNTWNGITKSSKRHDGEYLELLRDTRLISKAPGVPNSPLRHFIYGDITVTLTSSFGGTEKQFRFPAVHFLDPDLNKGGLVAVSYTHLTLPTKRIV